MMTKYYPPPIYGLEPDSWAESTILVRLPEIVNRTLNENKFPPQIVEKLIQLRDGIPDQPIRKLTDRQSPDMKDWDNYLESQVGKNWLAVPWFFAEHYFYRRIMEAVDYFNQNQDPFRFQKEQGLFNTRQDIDAFTAVLIDWKEGTRITQQEIQQVLFFSLWGNQADLSLWPAGSTGTPNYSSHKIIKDHLLADDSSRIIEKFFRNNSMMNRVDLMLDNAGFELVCDLGLADTLITHQLAADVILHVKAHPTFVSDVIDEDIKMTLDFLKSSREEAAKNLGHRLDMHFQAKRLITTPHFFWNSPLPMWEIPPPLREDLSGSDLLISKGDANYRRLLGDRHWDFTTPFQQVVDYLPFPLVALRTLKAELALGLDPGQIKEITNQDPNWQVNGKWGVVQFSPGVS